MTLFDGFKKKDAKEEKSTSAPETNNAQPASDSELLNFWREYRKTESENALNQFYAELCMNAQLLVVTLPAEDGASASEEPVALEKGQNIGFPALTSPDGERYLPVFTDKTESKKWEGAPSGKRVIADFDELADLVIPNQEVSGFVIDPFGDNILFKKDHVQHLKNRKDEISTGHAEMTMNTDESVQIKDVADFPQALADAAVSYMKTNEDISSAWLREMTRQGETSLLIVVDFVGNSNEVFGEIAKVTKPHMKTSYLDMIAYETQFGKDAVEGAEPFYKK